MTGAYRQILLQIPRLAFLLHLDTAARPGRFEIFGQPFGAGHSVPNSYRVAEWKNRVIVRGPGERECTRFCVVETFSILGF